MYRMLHLPVSLRKCRMDKVVLRKGSDIFPISVLKLKNYTLENRILLKRLSTNLQFRLSNKGKLEEEFDANLIFMYRLLYK